MKPQNHPLPDLISCDGPDRGVWKRIGLISASVAFFSLGIVGWVIPVMTGVPFHVLGLITLGMASKPIARTVNRWERRLPHRLRLWLRPKRYRKGTPPAESR
jgi:uncharacterized membrane protein YbaN (DUF454 family)